MQRRLHDDLVLHPVGKRKALRLLRIVAGDAGRGAYKDGAGRSRSNERAGISGELCDAIAGGFDEVANRHVVLGGVIHRFDDFLGHQRSPEVRVGARSVDNRAQAKACVHLHRFARGFGGHGGAAIRWPPGNAPSAPIIPVLVKKLRRVDREKTDIHPPLLLRSVYGRVLQNVKKTNKTKYWCEKVVVACLARGSVLI